MQMLAPLSRFIWINPVVESMAKSLYPGILEQIVERGFRVVTCSSGLEKVREAYRQKLESDAAKPVIDTRCPQIACVLNGDFPQLQRLLAELSPILMVCAQDLYEMYVRANPDTAELTIVTPCTALAEAGNRVMGDRARFVTWLDFCMEQKLDVSLPRAVASPIPPGYFQFPEYRILEANGPEAVTDLLTRIAAGVEEADLLELLYCHEGCHNGDGV